VAGPEIESIGLGVQGGCPGRQLEVKNRQFSGHKQFDKIKCRGICKHMVDQDSMAFGRDSMEKIYEPN
jgi:hypothetical protein